MPPRGDVCWNSVVTPVSGGKGGGGAGRGDCGAMGEEMFERRFLRTVQRHKATGRTLGKVFNVKPTKFPSLHCANLPCSSLAETKLNFHLSSEKHRFEWKMGFSS